MRSKTGKSAVEKVSMHSGEVLALLVRHIESRANGDQFIYIPECCMPNGRRVDLLALETWASHGYNRSAYEIKVSRSDFLGEMKQGTKTDTMLKYAHVAYFVVPKGLVTVDEVPVGCGLIEVTKQGCSYARKAQKSELTHDDTMSFLNTLIVQAVRRNGVIKTILATGGETEITTAHIEAARREGYKAGELAMKDTMIKQASRLQQEGWREKAIRAENAIKRTLGLQGFQEITDEHLAILLTMKDNSPLPFEAYKARVENFCRQMLPKDV